MTFEELTAQVQLKQKETRASDKDYLEVVVTAANLEAVIQFLQAYFGNPMKPKGVDPSSEVKVCARPYGGVMDDQTFYFKKSDHMVEAALLWPWNSGAATTVKIVREKQ